MDNMAIFPIHPGFLLPNGEFYATEGMSHQNLAFRILQELYNVKDSKKLGDAEFVLQDEYSALLIRYRWQEKLVYLPKTVPQTIEGRNLFKNAIKYYAQEGYKILNLYKISLSTDDYYAVKEFFVEDFEFIKKDLIIIKTYNFNETIVKDKNGKYMYNPERIGD